jgi:HK97 family phage portal protein
MKIIAEDIASCPWEVVVRRDGNQEVDPEDDVSWLLNNQPNEETIGQSLKEALMWDALGSRLGLGFAFIDRGGSPFGRPRALHWLSSARMNVERDPTSGVLLYVHKNWDGTETAFLRRDLLIIKGISLDSILGDSPVLRSTRAIATAVAMERYGINWFGNDARPGVVLFLPKELGGKSKAEEREAWRETYEKKHRGPERTNSTFVAPAGEGADVKVIDSNPEQSQLVESRRFQMVLINQIFRIPPYKLGDPASAQGYGRNLAEMGTDYAQTALAPWKNRIEQECTNQLFGFRSPRWVRVNTDHITRGDDSTFWDNVRKQRDLGVPVNRVLREAGKNTIGPAGDLSLVPNNLVVLTERGPQAAARETVTVQEGNQAGGTVPTDDTQMAQTATQRAMASALRSYVARLQAREADLRKNLKNGTLAGKLAEARQQFRQRAEAEISSLAEGSGRELHIAAALDSVERGGNINSVAEALAIELLGEAS